MHALAHKTMVQAIFGFMYHCWSRGHKLKLEWGGFTGCEFTCVVHGGAAFRVRGVYKLQGMNLIN